MQMLTAMRHSGIYPPFRMPCPHTHPFPRWWLSLAHWVRSPPGSFLHTCLVQKPLLWWLQNTLYILASLPWAHWFTPPVWLKIRTWYIIVAPTHSRVNAQLMLMQGLCGPRAKISSPYFRFTVFKQATLPLHSISSAVQWLNVVNWLQWSSKNDAIISY